MSVWDFDDDSGAGGIAVVRSEIRPSTRSTGGSFQVKKHAFFADAGDDDAMFSSEPPPSRRKQSGVRKELVLESGDCDDLDEASHVRASASKELEKHETSSSSSSAKVDEDGMPDIVHTVLRSKVSQPAEVPASTSSDKKRVSMTDLSQDHELFMYHLVREFLRQHGADDSLVNLLEKERPTPESSTAATTSASSSKKKSSGKSPSSSSTKKKKPALNVITSAEELENADEQNSEQIEIGYNRLNHPGSTPKPTHSTDAEVACILGDPGSTPKARVSDLRALGFDEDELNTPVPAENVSSLAIADCDHEDDPDGISDYARNKRTVKKHSKHVNLGESGATPRKECIFFRETPPSFVTETVEVAVEVYEKLVQDPAFYQQAAPQERFVELQSSEVSKYTIGQEVQGLGAQRNVSGVVCKVFGSWQCGSSGPGTIVIDTCPEP